MTIGASRIAVLVSAGRNPVSGAPRACKGDAVAMALARSIGADGVRVLHAGAIDEPALRDYLALGAPAIEVVPADAGRDVLGCLAARLADADLIVCGTRAERGAGSGVLPYALAAALDRPIVADVLEASVGSGEAVLRQFLPKGRRRRVRVQLPAVIVVHPLAPVKLAYAHARRASGRIDVTRLDAGAAGASEPAATIWTLSPAARQLVRLKAEEKRAAHERLQAAIAVEAKGGAVVNEGSDVDKAQVLLAYLRQHRLIEF